MSIEEMTVTVLATEIVEALVKDEEEEGFDLTAGLFGIEFSKWVRKIGAILTKNQEAVEIVKLIRELTDTECSCVDICNLNPDYGGSNALIYISADWTGNNYNRKPVPGDTLLDCLQKANKIKTEAKKNNL